MKAMQAMAKKKILMDSFSKGLEEVKKQNEEKKKMMMEQKQQKEESTA